MTTYEDIQSIYELHANKLVDIVKHTNEPIEGNVFTHHKNYDIYLPGLKRRKNLFTISKDKDVILEIGFNAGHSCLVFLLANPNAIIYAFDICEHSYVKLCLEYLQNIFGKDRLTLIEGDSTKTIFTPLDKHPVLYHIDGCHLPDIAKLDLENCYNLAQVGDVIILDDTNIYYLQGLWNEYIESNKLDRLYHKDFIYFEYMECRHEIGIKK
jgi:hypothetical protein